mgnify:CR=1 FL=1|tara:strand:+ start:996 stop:1730 length:735 start_codon:yes stop_codon:yes gene_type:complete
MYNTGKKVSIKRVLEKVYRDWGFNTEIVWADVIEWSSEAINILGVHPSYEDKISNEITLTKGRGELPCDIMHIIGVRDFNTGEPLVRSFDQYHLSNYYRCTSENVSSADCGDLVSTYTTNDNYIFANVMKGSLEISYRGMSLDEDGLPTIPDNDKYIRYVSLYIAEKLAMKLFFQDKLRGDKLQMIQGELAFATGSAKMAMVIPDVDYMQAWTNSSLRLIPTLNSHSSGFKYDSQPQHQKNHNS